MKVRARLCGVVAGAAGRVPHALWLGGRALLRRRQARAVASRQRAADDGAQPAAAKPTPNAALPTPVTVLGRTSRRWMRRASSASRQGRRSIWLRRVRLRARAREGGRTTRHSQPRAAHTPSEPWPKPRKGPPQVHQRVPHLHGRQEGPRWPREHSPRTPVSDVCQLCGSSVHKTHALYNDMSKW